MVKNTLGLKLRRDMRKSAMQFLAVILLCALGTWVYCGLDAAWRMLDVSIDKYFVEQNLANEWVQMPSVNKETLTRLSRIDGVSDVQARTSREVKVDLPHEPTVAIRGYDGTARINIPLIRQGAALDGNDLRGCLLEEQFAAANGFSVGDRIALKVDGERYDFVVRGLTLSPEYVITSKDVMPNPTEYGFLIYNAQAIPKIGLTEAVLTLESGADEKAVEQAIESMYDYALVVTREAHVSTQRTQNDVAMFRKLNYVFPVLAFGVAALIVLTTITRMLENQRTQMGTLKALGYRDGQIRRHYLSYAFYPSLVGALLGLIVGRLTLPYILWDMESIHYILPYRFQAAISPAQWLVCGIAVALASGICLTTYRKSAREQTASLLRPKPPKAGSRLLLERWTGLWRRLGFNSKMMIRNLFRNKLRTIMSLVGVLCCTMLIVTSMGLRDSVEYFTSNYYNGTLDYDVRADLTSAADELEAYQKRIDAERVDGVMEKSVSLRTDEMTRTTQLTVLEPNQQSMRFGEKHTLVELPMDGVAVSEKLASIMELHVGQPIQLWLVGDSEPIETTITMLVKVNIGQGVFVRSEVFDGFRKGAFVPTALLVKGATERGMQQLNDLDELDRLKYPQDQMVQTQNLLQSLTGVFSLMKFVAFGLAFVVQYNMGLLNFMERVREYATLKVLGYHQKEIRRLMFGENNLVTLIGIALGVVPGILLTSVVLHTCESSEMVFEATVTWPSVVIPCVLTYLFSLLIQSVLTRKVKSIDMVEALKSVE